MVGVVTGVPGEAPVDGAAGAAVAPVVLSALGEDVVLGPLDADVVRGALEEVGEEPERACSAMDAATLSTSLLEARPRLVPCRMLVP